MSINVEYGPISTALSLAQQAGEGQRRRLQQQADLAFMDQVTRQKAEADSAYANQIHNAIAVDSTNAQLQQHATAEANDYQLAQQRMQQQAQDNAATQSIQQQNANTAQQNAGTNAQRATDTNEHFDTMDMIRQNKADKPGVDNEYRLMSQEYRRLLSAQQQAQKNLDASRYDENDMKKLGTRQSSTVPGAIEGHEQQYSSAAQTLAALQQQIRSVNDSLNSKTQGVIAPGAAPVNQQVLKNYAGQQSAPDQQPRIVATATNPQTGERIGFDANTGQWVKLGA
jgi:hypothetical protein